MTADPPRLPPGRSESDDEDEEGGGLDLQAIKDYAAFVLGAPRRHKLLSIAVFLVVVALTKGVAWALPRTYHVESTLLAQQVNIDKVALQGRSSVDDAPTKMVQQTVLRRANLVALVEETKLTKEWDRTRSPLHQIKDWLMAKMGRAPSEADKFEALVSILESRISINLTTDWGGEGTITFAVDWPDPEVAYRLVVATQQNFLEQRHISEIENFAEGIAILRARAESVRNEIDATALQIENSRPGANPAPAPEDGATATRPEPSTHRPRAPAAAAPALGMDAATLSEAQRLKASWEGKVSAIRDLEDIRRRRLTEVQQRLTELRATYADSHPLVIDAMRSISVQQQESPQVTQLRQEEADLRARFRQLTGGIEPEQPIGGLSSLVPRTPRAAGSAGAPRSVITAATPQEGDDGPMELLKAQLRSQMATYDRLMDRIDSVQMEQDTSEAAFKYRYSVFTPPSVPGAPSKPNVPVIMAGGIALALLLAIVMAVLADLREDRILQRWQVERRLDLPVLGELRLKP